MASTASPQPASRRHHGLARSAASWSSRSASAAKASIARPARAFSAARSADSSSDLAPAASALARASRSASRSPASSPRAPASSASMALRRASDGVRTGVLFGRLDGVRTASKRPSGRRQRARPSFPFSALPTASDRLLPHGLRRDVQLLGRLRIRMPLAVHVRARRPFGRRTCVVIVEAELMKIGRSRSIARTAGRSRPPLSERKNLGSLFQSAFRT